MRYVVASEQFVRAFWASLTYVEMTQELWYVATDLWVQAVRVNAHREDSDVLIGALASWLGATVVSTNTKHFGVFGLPTEDWSV